MVSIEQNSKWERKIYGWFALYFCLPWLIPKSLGQAEVVIQVIQSIAPSVPAISKIATISSIESVITVYLMLAIILLPMNILHFMIGDSVRDRLDYAFSNKSIAELIKILVFVYFLAIPLFVGGCLLLINLPFDISSSSTGTSGQLFFSAMIGSRLGLSVFGAFLFVGSAIIGYSVLIFSIAPIIYLLSRNR